MKTCTKCKEAKDPLDFYKDKSKRDGLSSVCKVCDSKKGKLYREKNKVKVQEFSNNHYRLNREQILQKHRERYRKEPTKHLVKWSLRRSRKLQATPVWANHKYISIFYQLAKEETVRLGVPVEVDHIIPLKHKLVCGLHNEHNLQLLTREDNRQKGNSFYV